MLSENFLEFAQSFLSAAQGCDAIRAPDPNKVEASKKAIDELGQLRGRPLIYQMIPSGKGAGPFVEMLDGSVKMDLICGIGVHLFGHGHPALMLSSLRASLKATTMQGTLMPCSEYAQLLRLLLKHGSHVAHLGPEGQCELAAGWLTTCGTMANELALKIIRQKKFPAYKLISFKNCFAGRSTAMQELTDEPKYREGQPTFDQFAHIDFFDPIKSLDENIRSTKSQIDEILRKEPGIFCGMGFEVVQGEGGAFRSAPREWWVAILSHARKEGLGLWFDEVQTFGRTGELFAYQLMGLGEYVDVVSCAKPLQCAAVLWTKDYQPKPGLIAGTFAGGTTSLAVGAKVVEMLVEGDYFGHQGKIQKMEAFIREDLEERRQRLSERYGWGEPNITGGMIAFPILDGKAETIKNFLTKLFDNGVIGFSAGRDPVFVRFLPPMGVFTRDHWIKAMNIFEETLKEFNNVSSTRS